MSDLGKNIGKDILRIGISVKSGNIPNWQVYVLNKLIQDDSLEVLIFESKEFSKDPWNNIGGYKLQQKIGNRLFKIPQKFYAPSKSWKEQLEKNTRPFKILPLAPESQDRNLQLQDHSLEVFFDLADCVEETRNLNLTLGFWLLDPENKFDWFYALKEGRGVTSIRFKELFSNENFHYAFTTNFLSLLKNRNTFAWKSTQAILGLVRKLKKRRNTSFELSAVHSKVNTTGSPKKLPTTKDFLALWSRQAFGGLNKIWGKLFFVNQWYLLFKFDNDNLGDSNSYQKLKPSKDKFWADPHVIFRNEKAYVFFEELPFKQNVGHISCLEIDADGKCTKEEIVLKKDYHLSYPFVLEWEGETYMIPESNQNRTVELYKCTRFPNQWEFVMNLMEDIRLVDSTLFFYNNKWWLFAGAASEPWDSPNEELHLFYADSLLTTNWTPHPDNPISTDTSNARPAGPIFRKEDKIYRPAQNSSFVYGYGIQINEIITLTEFDYKEKIVSSIDPSEERTHTLSCYQDITLLDALSKRFSLVN